MARRRGNTSKASDRYIAGKNSCSLLLEDLAANGGESSSLCAEAAYSVQDISCFYVQPLKRGREEKGRLEQLAQGLDIPVKHLTRDAMDEMVHHVAHQGCILELFARKYLGKKELKTYLADKDDSIVVAVDELYDPANLGSILRAAECFGVHAVLWSKNRGVGVTPAVTKVSSGASERVPLVPVSNLRSVLVELQQEDFAVIVADGGEGSSELAGFSAPSRSVLVLGSEGKGVQPLIRKEADFSVQIPMVGKIDSLNVSQACAVFLSFISTR